LFQDDLPANRPNPQVTRLERSMNGVVVATLATLGALAFIMAVANQVRTTGLCM
jgi:hypothetical protein